MTFPLDTDFTMRLFALGNSPLLPAKLLQFLVLLLCIPPRHAAEDQTVVHLELFH